MTFCFLNVTFFFKFYFIFKLYIIVLVLPNECNIFCIHSSVDGQLTCFQFLAAMNNDSVSIRVHVSV